MKSALRNVALLLAGSLGWVCLAHAQQKPVSAKSSPSSATTAPIIDPQAMALLAKVEKVMLGLKTYQAECATTLSNPPRDGKPARERRESARLLAAKPNKMRYDQWGLKQDARTGQWARADKERDVTFVCDGKTNWKQFGTHYRTDSYVQPQRLSTILEPWDGFYAANGSPHGSIISAQQAHELLELRRDGRESVDGVSCDKVFAHIKTTYSGEAQEYWETWYIADDGMVRRKVERIEFGGKPGYTRSAILRNIRTNLPIAGSVFTYSPPKSVVSQKVADSHRPALLASGTLAPDFTALDIHQKPVKLSAFQGKVVVVDFWASWCGPCIASMPHSQEVARKLQAEGLPVVLLAVDNSEEREAFTRWVEAKSATFPSLTFVHIPPKTNVGSKLFHVSGIPTQYVVDKNGLVRASFVGFGGPTNALETAMRAALAVRAR